MSAVPRPAAPCEAFDPLAAVLQGPEARLTERQRALGTVGTAGQAKLKASRVLIVGVGGLGAPASLYLAGAGLGRLGLCDPDTVALHNLHRQVLYAWDEEGRSKALAAAERVARLNPWLEVEAHPRAFTAESAGALLAPYDAVYEGSDDWALKFLVHDACRAAGKLLVTASLHKSQGQIQVFDFRGIGTGTGPCLHCLWPEPPAPDCVGTCGQVGVLGPSAGALGLAAAHELLLQLLGQGQLGFGRMAVYDWTRHEARVWRWKARPGCGCGAGEKPQPGAAPAQFPMSPPLTAATRPPSAPRLLDLREPAERRPEDAWLLPAAEAAPLTRRADWEATLDPARPLLLVCASGRRSGTLAAELQTRGFFWVRSFAGGYEGLRRAAFG